MRSNLHQLATILLILAISACGGGSDTQPTPVTPTETSGSSSVTALKTIDNVTGSGAVAVSGKKLTVHYTGWLYDQSASNFKGVKFDSSVDRGQPFSFTLGAGQVITGWDQGFIGMKVGGKRTLTIPSAMGYGAQGRGSIPPNAALVFDVELLAVE